MDKQTQTIALVAGAAAVLFLVVKKKAAAAVPPGQSVGQYAQNLYNSAGQLYGAGDNLYNTISNWF